jgi:hypothetical protein
MDTNHQAQPAMKPKPRPKPKKKKPANRTARLTRKRVSVELPLELYVVLKGRYPGPDARAALSAIEECFDVEKAPGAFETHRVYKCIHPATGTAFSQLTRTEVARMLNLNRTTLIKHMNKAEAGGYKFTSNGWMVEHAREGGQ